MVCPLRGGKVNKNISDQQKEFFMTFFEGHATTCPVFHYCRLVHNLFESMAENDFSACGWFRQKEAQSTSVQFYDFLETRFPGYRKKQVHGRL